MGSGGGGVNFAAKKYNEAIPEAGWNGGGGKREAVWGQTPTINVQGGMIIDLHVSTLEHPQAMPTAPQSSPNEANESSTPETLGKYFLAIFALTFL